MIKNVPQILAQRVQRIKPSPTLAVSARATELQAQGKNIINLSVGEPDFDTPEHVKEAAIAAMRAGYTKYTAVDGISSLKQAIVNKFANENELIYQPSQILVSCGAKHSIFNILASVINPGDEVIIPAPYWVSYPDMVQLCDGTPVIVETAFSNAFKMSPELLEASITEKTRALIINSPSNPSGIAYSASELSALARIIEKYPEILIISDDIYEHNLWNHLPFKNILNCSPELYDRTIVVNGVSKSYAMTGWRIGYAAGPAKIIAEMKKAQSQTTSNPDSIAQHAALAALSGDQSAVAMMTAAYKERHDYLLDELQKISGIECIPSDGTFYTFPQITGLYERAGVSDDISFAEFLLNKAELAVIPGSAFGTPGHIRISYATHMNNLIETVKRLKALFDQ